MKRKDDRPGEVAELRCKEVAPERIIEGDAESLSPEEVRRTIHQLREHQIELQMQNEELRRTQAELNAARTRYFDLYDLAPVGYCTVSEKEVVLEANLTIGGLLGMARGALVGRRFSEFVHKEDQDTFYLVRKKLFENGEAQAFSARMVRNDGTHFWAYLETTAVRDEEGSALCRLTVSDISDRKQLEDFQHFLAQTHGGGGNEPFFDALARYLAENLEMDFICIDRLEGDGLTAQTVAVWCDGHFEDNVRYALKDTPCGDVVGKEVCCFPANVCQFFPRDQVLVDLCAESYIGVTLWGHTGQPIGLIAVIGRCPLANRPLAESMLKLVAVRAAGELERLESEEALRTSEERHRTILKTAIDGFWVVDAQGHLLEVNEAYCLMSGYSEAELLTMRIPDLEANETEDGTFTHSQMIVAQGEDRFESRHRRKDGTIIDVEVGVKYTTAENGQFVVFLKDITKRKRAEEALRTSRQMIEGIINAIPVRVFWKDRNLAYLGCNSAFARDAGFDSVKDIIGKDDFQMTWRDQAEVYRGDDRQVIESGCPKLLIEESRTTPDGTIITFLTSKLPLHDFEGNVVGVIGTYMDITRRKQNEDALRESEEHFRLLVENAPEAIFLQTDLRFTYLNASALRLFGAISSKQLLGQPVMDRFHPSVHEAVRARIHDLNVAQQSVGMLDEIYLRLDGSEVPVEVAAVPITFEGKNGALVFARDITERKQAEEALRESEERLKDIMFSVADWIWETDANGVYTYSSQKSVDILGLSWEEIIGKTPFDFMPADEAGRMRAIFSEIAAQKAPIRDLENWGIGKSGERICLLTNGVPILDQEGNLKGYRGVDKDITEHKRAEETLALNLEVQIAISTLLGISLESMALNEFLDRALDLVLSLKWLAVESKGAIFLADEAGETLHLHAHKGLSKDFHTMCSTIPFGRCLCGRAAATRTIQFADRVDEHHDTHYEGMAPHGHYCVPVLSGGHILGVMNLYVREGHTRSPLEEEFLKAVANTLAGAVERRRTDEALLESEEFNRRLIASSQDCIKVLDLDGNLLSISEGGQRLLEIRDINRYLNTSFLSFWKPEDQSRVCEAIDAARVGRVSRFQGFCPSEAGSPHWWDVIVTPIYDAEERVERLLATSRDITAHMQAEEEKAGLEAQLQQAQKMESVGRLAGGVAHDFNNMLAVILGYTEVALSQLDPGQPLHADLLEVRNAATRSADLTRQLLTFARKQTVMPKVLDLNETVTGMLRMLERLIGENIELKWFPKAELWPVKVDPSQIDQILANLCLNAREAISDVGRLSIETANLVCDEFYCSCRPDFSPGEYVLLVVNDNGCGMDRKLLGSIFEPFFTTKELGKGTGLGLATVYGIVKQNNGFINVYSEVGQGTTFTIYLPRHRGTAVQAPPESAAGTLPRGQETILLVEDEPALLRVIAMKLHDLGYTVLAAVTPGDALRLAGEHSRKISLLITDVVMPEMNGRELANNILSLYPHIRHIFMSGYTADVIARHGVLDEGNHFIQKPFSANALAAKVREALDSPKGVVGGPGV